MSPQLHRCSSTACPYLGQPSPENCGCHLTNEQVLAEQRDELLEALEGVLHHEIAHVGPYATQRREAARAAIAKAGGAA